MAAPLVPLVDPRRIEAEIARVRERASSGFGGGVKTNLFNLVVLSAADEWPETAVDALLGRRPARILRLGVQPAGPATAAVSGKCSPGQPDLGVCLEQIDLAAGEDPLGAGAGLWTPLLERDVPTLLWIAGRWSPDGHSLPRGEAAVQADKLIVDSARADDPLGALAALHRLRAATRGRLAIADLAWSRTFPIRVLCARAFDPPEARDVLDAMTSVRIAGAARAEALLFSFWLAARLGWRAAAGPELAFQDAAGRAVAVVHEAPAPLARGLRLSFAGARRTIDLSCTANGCAELGGDREPWQVAADGELLLAEVDTLKQDLLLVDVLALAAGWAAPAGAGAGGGRP